MGTLILRWFLSKKVRQSVDMGRQVRKLISAQRDLLSPEEVQEISKAARELSNAIAAGDRLEGIEKRMKNLEKVANENLKPYPSASLRENIEVFLVTGAVVLALRTFFFQPMAIPSGSAQPTLWGITSENFLGRPDVKFPTSAPGRNHCLLLGSYSRPYRGDPLHQTVDRSRRRTCAHRQRPARLYQWRPARRFDPRL